MGFSFRSKNTDTVVERVDTANSTGSDRNTEEQLAAFRRQHRWDPFLEVEKLNAVDHVLAAQDVEKEAEIQEALIVEDSPYPEVRASVSFSSSDCHHDILLLAC